MASRLVGPTKTGYAFSSIVACDNRDTARHIELLRFKAGLLNTSRLPVPFEVELPAQAVAKASPLPENRDCIPELEKSAPIAGTAQGRRQVTGPRRDMCLLRLRQLAPRQMSLRVAVSYTRVAITADACIRSLGSNLACFGSFSSRVHRRIGPQPGQRCCGDRHLSETDARPNRSLLLPAASR
jgi:hypothetical protein